MSVNSHLSRLNDKHQSLDEQISEALKRPQPDMFLVSQLKKEKLRLKDQITRVVAAR